MSDECGVVEEVAATNRLMTYVLIFPEIPTSKPAASLLAELARLRATLTGDYSEPALDLSDLRPPGSLFVVAWDQGLKAVGCGAFRPLREKVAELRYMYARPNTKGVGASLLRYLEASALETGYDDLWLGTRVENERAVRFYEFHGFCRIANYGKYVGNAEAICFEKKLRSEDRV